MVSFNTIPSGTRVPFTFVEFDSSNAQQGPSIQVFRTLVVGQRTSAGSTAALVKKLVTNADQAGELFGRGSMLHGMAEVLFQNNQVTACDFVALDDNGSNFATGTFTFSGTATEPGTAYVYVAGRRFAVPIATGDASTAVAAAVEAALDLDDSLPAAASVATSVVTMTANNAGTVGNDIDLRVNYFEGESLPAGISVVVAAMSGGATDPDISTVWPVLGDVGYNAVVSPYRDASNLTALEAEMADRGNATRKLGGMAYVGARGSHSTLITLGDSRNSNRCSIIGANLSPTPTYEWAAALAGVATKRLQADPARPIQRQTLAGVMPPLDVDQFTLDERNLLLNDGITSWSVNASGLVSIDRVITTFQVNSAGAPSKAFLDANTVYTLDYLRYDYDVQLLSKYPDSKLAQDGTQFAAGQKIVTPSIIRDFSVGVFAGWEFAGLVEGKEQFKRDLVVNIAADDPNAVEVLLPPDLVNQFRIAKVQIGFLL